MGVRWRLGVVGLVVAVASAGCGAGTGVSAGGHPGAGSRTITRRGAVAAVKRTASARQSSATWRECEQAARRAGFPIACPIALPPGVRSFWANGLGRGECGPTSGSRRLRRWTWVGAYFRAGAGFGRLVVASAPRLVSPQDFVYAFGTARPYRSPHVTVAGTTVIRGHIAEYVHPSRDPNVPRRAAIFLGHTFLIWTADGHTYAIGATGHNLHARRYEAFIARRLRLAGPPSNA
jgi:hypothetical protein